MISSEELAEAKSALALGFRRIGTYTLKSEPGTSRPRPPPPENPMTADTREVIAKIVDPIAMMTFEEEVERLHRELSKAIPSLTKDDPSLLGLARDNIAESFDDRNAALAKADAILALSAPTPAVTEEQVEAMARAHYEPFGQSWDALVRAAPEYAEKLRSAMRAALAALTKALEPST